MSQKEIINSLDSANHSTCGLGCRAHLMGFFNFNTMEKQKEIWKDVPVYEGYYQVSNYGRVKSLERTVKNGPNSTRVIRRRILKQTTNSRGYLTVHLSVRGNVLSKTVHRLTCAIFHSNPENKPEVNHKNGIKTDNYWKNLEWATVSENRLHSYRTGLQSPAMLGRTGVDCKNSIPVIQLYINLTFKARYVSGKEASDKTGINRMSISDACNGIQKTAGGFIWRKEK